MTDNIHQIIQSTLSPNPNQRFKLLSAVGLVALFSTLSLGCAMSHDTDEPSADVSQTSERLRHIKEDLIAVPPVPPTATKNLSDSAQFFVDPQSLAKLRADALRAEHPEQSQILDRIAHQPMGLWMGNWNSDIYRSVDHLVSQATAVDQVPVMIAYNIPLRDCGQHSAGGLSSKEEYQRWIRLVHAGIGDRPAVVILEPDALGHFQECLSEEQKSERMFLLSDAVKVLRQNPQATVYLDAGHARWVKAPEMAERLKLAGIEHAHGFALNVSNYVSTEENLSYGHELSALVADKPFVIDTSRNGAGPYEAATTSEESWCNPPGRKIGQTPTTQTDDASCAAFLWLKRPGESDGECGGGPRAGVFWTERALEMASID